MAYRTAAKQVRIEEDAKGSRFLGHARTVGSAAEFGEWLEGLRLEHPEANHHCWAYRVGNEMRSSDDGEPGGTAGRPILEVILKRSLDRLGIVVVRYFGGTKLGAGGLVRAYGGTAAKALDAAGERFVEDLETLNVHVPFAAVDPVHRLISGTRRVRALEEEYDEEGWRVSLEMPEVEADGFRERLADLTRGAAQVEEG